MSDRSIAEVAVLESAAKLSVKARLKVLVMERGSVGGMVGEMEVDGVNAIAMASASLHDTLVEHRLRRRRVNSLG